MSERVVHTVCRCGQRVVILNTRRAKRIAINPEPKGHQAYRYRDWERTEAYYVHGDHQPHVMTCTAPAPEPGRRRYV